MLSFFVIGFLCVTGLYARNQFVTYLGSEEMMGFPIEVYNDNNCAFRGTNSMCKEEVSEQIKRKLANKLRTLGDNVLGQNVVEVNSRNSIIISDHCELCLSKSILRIEPTVLNVADEKLYVVQTNKYQQRFDIHECESNSVQKNSPCLLEKQNTSQTTSCKQKYSEVRVLAFDAEKDVLVNRRIKYYAGCVCVVEE